MAVATLTDQQKRMLDDYIPALSNRAPGIDFEAILTNIISLANDNETALGGITSGTAVVPNGTDNVITALSGLDGSPVVAVLAEADGAIVVKSAVWDGSDNLTITTSALVTADRDVFYIVDAR